LWLTLWPKIKQLVFKSTDHLIAPIKVSQTGVKERPIPQEIFCGYTRTLSLPPLSTISASPLSLLFLSPPSLLFLSPQPPLSLSISLSPSLSFYLSLSPLTTKGDYNRLDIEDSRQTSTFSTSLKLTKIS
jgi:hypothetical protein